MRSILRRVVTFVFLILLTVALTLSVGVGNFSRKVGGEVETLMAQTISGRETVITLTMLANLPAPVRRHLTYAGVIGKTIPQTIRLNQTGRIRQGAADPWMNITATEYYSVNPPGFIWVATARTAGLPLVRVRDTYRNGRGNMLITLSGLLTLGDATGPEMDQGAMMRYLNEMTWFPAAFLGDNVTWKAIDDRSAEVTFAHRGKRVSATMYFDDAGRLTNFVARRYRTVPGGYSLETWSTPITAYGEFEGLRLPVGGKGVWNLTEGDLEYIDLTITDVEFDVSEVE